MSAESSGVTFMILRASLLTSHPDLHHIARIEAQMILNRELLLGLELCSTMYLLGSFF